MCQGYRVRTTPQAASTLMDVCGAPEEEELAQLDLPCAVSSVASCPRFVGPWHRRGSGGRAPTAPGI